MALRLVLRFVPVYRRVAVDIPPLLKRVFSLISRSMTDRTFWRECRWSAFDDISKIEAPVLFQFFENSSPATPAV